MAPVVPDLVRAAGAVAARTNAYSTASGETTPALLKAAEAAALPYWDEAAYSATTVRAELALVCRRLDRLLAHPLFVVDMGGERWVSVLSEAVLHAQPSTAAVWIHTRRCRTQARTADLFPTLASHWCEILHGAGQRALRSRTRSADASTSERARQWVLATATRLARRDPRFRRLQQVELPRALGLDPALLGISARASLLAPGEAVTAANYLLVRQHAPQFRKLSRENPGLLPLLLVAIREGLVSAARDPVPALHRELLFDLPPRAWRYLVTHGCRILRIPWAMSTNLSKFGVAVHYLRELVAAGLPPPPAPSVLRAWLRMNVNEGTERIRFDASWNPIPPPILEIALREADRRRGRSLDAAFLDTFLSVGHWANATEPEVGKQERRAGWSWAVRKALWWERKERALADAEPVSWHTWPLEVSAPGLSIVQLSSAKACVEEGFAMRNCIARYRVFAAEGQVRLFSVRLPNGRRFCNIGIHYTPDLGLWQVLDVKGPCNSPPPAAMERLAAKIAQSYPLPEPADRFLNILNRDLT